MLAAPVCAQVFIAFFAIMFVAMVVGPRWTQHRVAARFAALAAASKAKQSALAPAFERTAGWRGTAV
ncbi:MAG: hypothetical protein ABI537_15875 [Casimicrobiaceae bacterium]